MKVIAIANHKGGVGKTTTAVTLAHGLARRGKAVLLIDLDPQGQAAVALGLRREPGVYYLLTPPPGGVISARYWMRPARDNFWLLPGDATTNASQVQMHVEGKPYTHIADQIRQLNRGMSLDYILFDTAPSVGGIQERAVWACDLLIVPTATEFLSADGVKKTMEMLVSLKEKAWRGALLGVLPTFYDEHTRESRATFADLRRAFHPDQLLPPIHRATILRECAAEGLTVWERAPYSRAAQEYQHLVDRVLKAS